MVEVAVSLLLHLLPVVDHQEVLLPVVHPADVHLLVKIHLHYPLATVLTITLNVQVAVLHVHQVTRHVILGKVKILS